MDDRTPEVTAQSARADTYMRTLLKPLAEATTFGGAHFLGASLLPAFVLRNGVPFAGRPLPSHYKMRPPKQCYFNARSMVVRSKRLVYYEGYCASYELAFPFNHAWVVDPKGQLVDPTLGLEADSHAYLGVPVPVEYLTRDKCWNGQFTSRYETIQLDTLYRLDPGFREVVEKLKEGKCPIKI